MRHRLRLPRRQRELLPVGQRVRGEPIRPIPAIPQLRHRRAAIAGRPAKQGIVYVSRSTSVIMPVRRKVMGSMNIKNIGKKQIIAIISVIVVLIGAGIGWYQWDISQKNAAFVNEAKTVFDEHLVIANEWDTLTKNSVGRNFNSIFSDINNMKQKNTDVKLKLASLQAQTSESQQKKGNFTKLLNDFDSSLTAMSVFFERQQAYQTLSAWGEEREDTKKAATERDNAYKKLSEASHQYVESQKVVLSDLGLPPRPEKEPSSDKASTDNKASNETDPK